MIRKTTRVVPNSGARRPITASQSITSNVRNRSNMSNVTASVKLSPEKAAFARQLRVNSRMKGQSIMAATNTANIAARPDFLELLPLFVQKLLVLDIFGSVAMKSRQQIIPYFKFVAENTKGETKGGDVLSSPFTNRQGIDPNFTGRVIKNESVVGNTLMYTPILPGSLTLGVTTASGAATAVDKGDGKLYINNVEATGSDINYATGAITIGTVITAVNTATYQYDNETVGPDTAGNYGAKMAKGYLTLDEFDLKAEAHELACYWSVYSAFAADQEYGANISDIAKEAAFSELTAEINSAGFRCLENAASYKPQFNWDASPVLSGAVVPSDYLNMFKLKLSQAANAIYQTTRLARPNRLLVGSNTSSYISMINSFKPDSVEETVGPYKLGTLDEFEVFVDPDMDADKWVMACKSNDIRRNSALFGTYLPVSSTQPIGLANMSVQAGMYTMYGMKCVNPDSVISGRIFGSY